MEYVQYFLVAQNKHIQPLASKCYDLGEGTVDLMLFFGKSKDVSGIGLVLANTDTPKAKCFIDVYNGRSFTPPPFEVFTIKMTMGNDPLTK